MSQRPRFRLLPGAERRAQTGHPWIYSNEIEMSAELKSLRPGTIATAARNDGRPLGIGMFNPRSLIAFRFLSRDPDRNIDLSFFAKRMRRALDLRHRLYAAPFFRLVHAEADGFPGCVIDRYGDLVVISPNSAGADLLSDDIAAAVDSVVAPKSILLSADGPARTMEGLEPIQRMYKGSIDGPREILENDTCFLIEPEGGQKTGWFFDQRDNRRLISELAKGCDVLDLYSYLGGFGIQALKAGAKSVLAVDRSAQALELARKSADLNRVDDRFTSKTADAFDFLTQALEQHRSFDVVVADPPAFAKARKDFQQAARAYRKLARLAAGRVRTGGFLFIASCSHNMPAEEFRKEIARGLHEAGRSGRILYATGAGPDHPVHPMLPESAYLKALILQID